MKTLFKAMLATLAFVLIPAQAAGKHDYTYTPTPGVHEVKFFHGCFDSDEVEKRPKVDVTMNGLSLADVTIETKPQHLADKPSSQMITFRLKNLDASLSVLFRSHDGPHCQQGVASIAFRDVVLHNVAELQAHR